MADSDAGTLAQALLDHLRRHVDLSDPRVAEAFASVPRHIFLPDLPLEKVYQDEAVPIKHDEYGMVVSSSSQPSMMVLMLNQLQLRPGDNVLEIGTGTGYNAAILKHIVGESGNVTSLEFDSELAEQAADNLQRAGLIGIRVIHGDGALGYAPRAAYDRIISTVGVWDVPRAWVQQLKPDGILVVPLWLNGLQVSAAFTMKPHDMLYSGRNIPCGFVHLRGAAAGPPVQKRVNGSSLALMCDNLDQIDTVALHMLLSDDHEETHLGLSLSAHDYWYGLLPFVMINEPEGFTFVLYGVGDNQTAYGLEGHGFGLTGPASAVFVPNQAEGKAHCYAGSDALMALHDALVAWESAARPSIDRLRLRLVPLEGGKPGVKNGKLYTRHHHYLHVWLDMSA